MTVIWQKPLHIQNWMFCWFFDFDFDFDFVLKLCKLLQITFPAFTFPRILLEKREAVLTTRVCWRVSVPHRGDCGKNVLLRTMTETQILTPAHLEQTQTAKAAPSHRVPPTGTARVWESNWTLFNKQTQSIEKFWSQLISTGLVYFLFILIGLFFLSFSASQWLPLFFAWGRDVKWIVGTGLED